MKAKIRNIIYIVPTQLIVACLSASTTPSGLSSSSPGDASPDCFSIDHDLHTETLDEWSPVLDDFPVESQRKAGGCIDESELEPLVEVYRARNRKTAVAQLRARGLDPIDLEPSEDVTGIMEIGSLVQRNGRRYISGVSNALFVVDRCGVVHSVIADSYSGHERGRYVPLCNCGIYIHSSILVETWWMRFEDIRMPTRIPASCLSRPENWFYELPAGMETGIPLSIVFTDMYKLDALGMPCGPLP